MGEPDILDVNDEVLVQAYRGDNYQYVDTGADSNLCYIMFSSNGLYYPNTKEVFTDIIIKRDRYEWKWVVKNSHILQMAARVIYVRDIYKCWYAKGINAREDTTEKTLELLKKLTQGYRIVTVGSSAGGYMAVLAAIKLKADYCFNFSGQYSIADNVGTPYYNLAEMLSDYRGTVFYFLPIGCESDKKHWESVKNIECVKTFQFDDDKHAATMLTGNMCHIVDKSKEEMILLYQKCANKKINKLMFLIKTVPLNKIWGIIKKELQGFLIRRSGKHWTGV